jgi:hypothetical protein
MGTVRAHFMPLLSMSALFVVSTGSESGLAGRRGGRHRDKCIPGNSRSARLDISGPSPSFGAAIKVRLCTQFRAITGLRSRAARACDLNNRWSIFEWVGGVVKALEREECEGW